MRFVYLLFRLHSSAPSPKTTNDRSVRSISRHHSCRSHLRRITTPPPPIITTPRPRRRYNFPLLTVSASCTRGFDIRRHCTGHRRNLSFLVVAVPTVGARRERSPLPEDHTTILARPVETPVFSFTEFLEKFPDCINGGRAETNDLKNARIVSGPSTKSYPNYVRVDLRVYAQLYSIKEARIRRERYETTVPRNQ